MHLSHAVLAASLVVGIVFAVRVRPGLPYDEPSHWATSLDYGRLHALPILGRPGVPYEAQQGPIAYVLTSLLSGVVHAFGGGERASFYAARALCGAELLVAACYLYRIVARIVASRAAAASGMTLFALAPMFLAMGWSVQNDSLFLAVSFLAIDHALSARNPSGRTAFVTGLLTGLAIVCKLAAAPLIVAIPAWYLLTLPRAQAFISSSAFFLGSALTAGWWFVWNLAHYSRLTPPTTLGGGPDFPAYGFRGGRAVTHLVQEAVTYLWIPSEYYRNLLAVPAPLKALLLIVTIVLLAAGSAEVVRAVRRRSWSAPQRKAVLLVGATAAVTLVVWVVVFVEYSSVAPRFAYLVIPGWIALASLGLRWVRERTPLPSALVFCSLPALCLALDVWVLVSSVVARREPFTIGL